MLFLFCAIILFNSVAWSMKKNLRAIEYYACIFWGLFISDTADRFTDKYDAYGFFSPYFIEVKTFLVSLGIYPAATMIIINWYPHHRTLFKKIVFLIGCSIFSTIFEWLCLKNRFFYHHHWNIWYSAISYPFLYGALILNLRFVQKLSKK